MKNLFAFVFILVFVAGGPLACSGSPKESSAPNDSVKDASSTDTDAGADAGSVHDSAAAPSGISVAGTWTLRAQWGTGESVGPMLLVQNGESLTGEVSWWYVESTGATRTLGTMLTGVVSGSSISLNRVDSSGFASLFVGAISLDGNTMAGSVTNDPNSPGGNSATGTWSATRSADGGVPLPVVGDGGSEADGSSGASCVALAQCCAELTGTTASVCASVIGQHDEISCATALVNYTNGGQCGSASAVDAGGVSTNPPGDGGTTCGPPAINSLLGFTPTACMANGICSAILGSSCSSDQTTLDACPCEGVELCCFLGNGEICYYNLDASAIADEATNCENLPGSVSLSP